MQCPADPQTLHRCPGRRRRRGQGTLGTGCPLDPKQSPTPDSPWVKSLGAGGGASLGGGSKASPKGLSLQSSTHLQAAGPLPTPPPPSGQRGGQESAGCATGSWAGLGHQRPGQEWEIRVCDLPLHIPWLGAGPSRPPHSPPRTHPASATASWPPPAGSPGALCPCGPHSLFPR